MPQKMLTLTRRSKSNASATNQPRGFTPNADKVCYHCRNPGHMKASCPLLATPQASVNPAPRPTVSAIGRAESQASAQPKRTNQSFGRGRVNFVTTQDAEETPEVVLGKFPVNSAPATVLFDSGASHSFISSKFATNHGIPTILLKKPLLMQSPGGNISCLLECPRVKILLSGVEFLTDLVVLDSMEIDVILGMDWLSSHQGNISCSDRKVTVTNHQAIKVECRPQGPKIDPIAYHMEAVPLEEVPVIYEYPDVFPDELPGMPPDRDVEFITDLIPGTAPIAKRPYRML